MNQSQYYSLALAFGELGISMRTVFPDSLDRTGYASHTWLIVQKEPYNIIHAVPLVSELESSFWEVWYTTNNSPVEHYVLYCKIPSVPYHDLFNPPEQPDGLCPPEVYGRSWFVIENLSMLAWGVQKLLNVD